MDSGEVTLLAVGDVFVDRERPTEAFEAGAAELLRTGDIVFGNCETTYSERGARHPTSAGAHRAHPRNALALGSAGFTIMSCANNHMPGHGPEAIADTIEFLRQQGILSAGAGANLSEARAPAITTVRGTRVGFLAYCCVYYPAQNATATRAGIATLRARTLYDQVDIGQPGTIPLIHTYADRGDLDMLRDDVAKLKGTVDLVAVSFHWGIHHLPAVLADYEHEMAAVAIDAGADLILGHHQHILKGIETYRGKAIFHGLGNFVCDLPDMHQVIPTERLVMARRTNGEYAPRHYPDYPTFPFHPEVRQSIIAGAVISGGRIVEVGFRPSLINPKGQQVPQTHGTAGWRQVVDYTAKITRDAGLDTAFAPSQRLGPDWLAVELGTEKTEVAKVQERGRDVEGVRT